MIHVNALSSPIRVRAAIFVALSLLVAWSSSAARADLVITEIHYDPRDPDGVPRPDLEFVEIFNDGPEAYDLSGYGFTRGLTYVFAEATYIRGRSYLVICRDEDAVRERYGITNTLGNFTGSLDNSGETVALSNPQGNPVTTVQYNDRGQWRSGAKGTGHSLSIESPYRDPDDPDDWQLSVQFGGTPGRVNFASDVTFEDTTIVPNNALWRYFKGRVAPPSDWRSVAFDDDTWHSGRTGIGYGDGDDVTELTDMRDNYLTVFCRHEFTVDDVDAIDSLVLRVTYDDGFVAYLNGTEVARRNVTGSDFDDEADSADEPTAVDVNISSHIGRLDGDGPNVLAVSVHNGNIDSSDLSFIPELVSRRTILPEESETVPVVVNEGHFFTAGTRFVELYNDSSAAVDLSGYWLTDDFADLMKVAIAGGTSIPARGFLSFTEAELGLDLAIVEGVRERVEIALVNPAGTRVVDARLFEPKFEDLSEARYPDGEENFAPAATPTLDAANELPVTNDVVFNEIMYHPMGGNSLAEFIEFYNRGDIAHDIGGWTVGGVGYELPPDTVIGPGEYLVIARNPAGIRSAYGLDESVVVDLAYEGSLANGGERLRLRDPFGNVADKVRYYDGGDWSSWADSGGSSLERIDPFGESSVASSWDASDDSDKAGVQSFSYLARHGGGDSDLGMMLMAEGIAIVDNVTLTRSGGGSNMVSNGTFDSSTSPWRIEGTHIRSGRTTDPDERITGAGSLKLISYNGTGDYKVNRVETNTSSQSNGTTYRVSFDAKWRVGSPTILTIGDYNVGNPSSSGLAGSNRLPVPRRLGSPGQINTVTQRQIDRFGTANAGPAIDRVRHDPCVPAGGEEVTVRARVRDPDSVATVRLYYRTNSAGGSYTQRTMSDPDGNGVYTATIPGQSEDTRVVFFIEATDGEGLLERYPRDLTQRSHPPMLDPDDPAARELLYCMYRHAERFVSTDYHSLRFVTYDENISELRNRRVLSNEMLEGTFLFGGNDCYYNAKLRFAGSPWLRPGGGTWGKSYSFKIPKDNPLHGRKTAFNLDNHGRDGRERYTHFLFRRVAGATRLPYFDTHALARFELNDIHSATLEMLDKPNRQYIDFWFPESSDGPHFEMDDRFSFNDSGGRTGNAEGKVLYPPYGGTSGGTNKENYRWFFAVRNRKGEDDFSPLMDFCRVMDSRMTNSTTFDRTIFGVANVEEICRVFAVELNIDHWDTWGGNRGKNCYFFQAPVDGRWYLIPWDVELTYSNVTRGEFNMPSTPSGTIGNHFSEVARFLNRPRIKRMYYGVLKEMLDDVYYTGGDSPLSTFSSQLSGSGVNAGNVLNFVNQRRNYLLNRVNAAAYPAVRLRIETNGGSDFLSPTPFVDLDGESPADVFLMLLQRNGEIVDDVEFEFSRTSMRDWSIDDVPLVGGVNTLSVLGFNSKGELVDQDTIRVTSPDDWLQPVVEDISPDPAAVREVITITGREFHNGLIVNFDSLIDVDNPEFDEDADPTTIRVVIPDEVVPGPNVVTVRNLDGQVSAAVLLDVLPPEPLLVRGDVNLDGAIDVSDGVKVLFHLFSGHELDCVDGADVDDDGAVAVTDAIRLLDFLFRSGAAPAAPFPDAGRDPTADALGCESSL